MAAFAAGTATAVLQVVEKYAADPFGALANFRQGFEDVGPDARIRIAEPFPDVGFIGGPAGEKFHYFGSHRPVSAVELLDEGAVNSGAAGHYFENREPAAEDATIGLGDAAQLDRSLREADVETRVERDQRKGKLSGGLLAQKVGIAQAAAALGRRHHQTLCKQGKFAARLGGDLIERFRKKRKPVAESPFGAGGIQLQCGDQLPGFGVYVFHWAMPGAVSWLVSKPSGLR